MELWISYDYEELLDEIISDLQEGLITLNDPIKIVRSPKKVSENYYPIVDYYYNDDICEEPYKDMNVQDVVNEMREKSRIF